MLVCFFRMILLCLSKKDFMLSVQLQLINTYGMSVENIVKFVTGRKMFVKES